MKSLQGLQSIADRCKKLEGLNLLGIPVGNVENQVQLWEILSNMNLTHLAVKSVKERMCYLFQQCSVLQALEVYNDDLSCSECGEFVSEDLIQVSYSTFQCSVIVN